VLPCVSQICVLAPGSDVAIDVLWLTAVFKPELGLFTQQSLPQCNNDVWHYL
jgi:hypothetical protein